MPYPEAVLQCALLGSDVSNASEGASHRVVCVCVCVYALASYLVSLIRGFLRPKRVARAPRETRWMARVSAAARTCPTSTLLRSRRQVSVVVTEMEAVLNRAGAAERQTDQVFTTQIEGDRSQRVGGHEV